MRKNKQKIVYDSSAAVLQSMMYTDPYRVLAEYVDNAIDAAEAYYSNGTYTSEIKITVRKTDGKIIISDNATGMTIKPDEPYKIFGSAKRNDPSTNGMFGFGMFSFMAICDRLEIETWHRASNLHRRFVLSLNDFNSAGQSEPEFEIESSEYSAEALGGTHMTLYDFREGQFEDISMEKLRSEIEKHFELILQRPNITVKLIDDKSIEHICVPFKYMDFCRQPYNKTISNLHKTHSKKQRSLKEYDISETPAKIFLIASPDKEFNRPVFFVVKGRRVADVSSIEHFRTNRKFQIWAKSNVTGYIDVTEILSPVLSRKDFVRDERSKAFFQTLLGCEEEILRYIESKSQLKSSERLKDLESKINEVLKELTQQECNNGNYAGNSRGRRVFIIKGVATKNTSGAVHQGLSNTSGPISSSLDRTSNRTRNRIKNHKIELLSNTNRSESGPAQLEVRIDSNSQPHTDLDGIQLRSVMSGNTVHIFRKHEDFQIRVKTSPKGHEEVNQRLISYIAMEVSLHYLNRKINQTADSNHENRIRKFVSMVLRLENKLKSLDGTKI